MYRNRGAVDFRKYNKIYTTDKVRRARDCKNHRIGETKNYKTFRFRRRMRREAVFGDKFLWPFEMINISLRFDSAYIVTGVVFGWKSVVNLL